MRVTSKGQVTIPQEIRDRLGIQPGADLRFEIDGEAIRVTKATDSDRGRDLVERLRGRASRGLTTDEILALTRE
ncbi:MAG TPA: AbrB/MazE/SpoVT family DNA-binding domain-containing protein [Solirubrobacter sp.]|nr:AbrB/MazE/SpoVT family DNA-binding domain-containing protein [Solirubrobacter sp.]